MGDMVGRLQEQAWFLLSVAWASPVLTAMTLLFLVMLWSFLGGGKGDASERAEEEAAGTSGWQEASADLMRRLGAPEYPHMEGSFLPSKGLVLSNHSEGAPFETEACKGKFFSLCKATDCREKDKPAACPHGEYFLGKKRLWEARVQFTVKQPFNSSDMFFGVEQDQYSRVSGANKRSMQLMVQTLKAAVGNQVNHSVGDDPKVVSGERELPLFVMPLMAFDQYIVTPEGEVPPDLLSHNLHTGSRRLKRVKEYKKELEQLTFEVGPTYTFCFWGISQWMDKINWKLIMPFGRVDCNALCGYPPLHVVMYSIKDRTLTPHDRRHLKSRRIHFFDLAMWSSKVRPPWEKVSALLASDGSKGDKDDDGGDCPSRRGLSGVRWSSMCCGGR